MQKTLEKRKTRKDQKAKESPTPRQEDIFIKISKASLQTPIIFAWKDPIITEWVLEWALLSYNLCNLSSLQNMQKAKN